jgi:hypothetical protein
MAENINALILPIGADATQFERSINDVKSAFKELSATIAATPFNLVTDKQKLQLNALKETLTVLTTDVKTFGQAIKIPENSILGLTQRIAELNKKKINLDAKTSAAEIARLTKEIERLTAQKNNIDALGASVQKIGQSGATSFKKLEDSSKRGRLAINSLSLVAQDLPFGFIAIQNNLPAVISSFGALSVGSKGLSASLIALKGALIGPAGLFLAFSVITGALTFAVQKYGSFGAALDAITGNTNEFTKSILKANKSLEEYNKESKSTTELRNDAIGSVEDEIIKVNTLAEVLRTSTSTDRQKQGALAELKKANDEYFGKLNAQKIDLDLLNESVGKYTESLIKNKVAQNIASEAASVYTEFLKQNQIAFDISQKINAILKEVPTLTKQLDDYNKKRDKLIATGEITSIRFIPISKELNQYLSLNEELREVNVNVKSTANSYGLLKTQADLAYKAASGFLDLQKDGEGKGKIPGLREIIEGTQGEGVITTNLALFEKYIQAQVRINNAGVDEMVRYRREQLNALDLIPKKLEKDLPTLGIGLPFGPEALKNLQEYYNLLLEIQDIDQDIINILTKGLGVENIYEKAIKDLLNFEAFQKATADRISRNFRFLQRPLENLFDTVLEDGIANWQAFGDAVVSEIKKIAAALLAKSFITLLGNLLAPGVGSILGKAFSGISTDGLGDWLDIFDPQGSKVNFAGVQGGGMQMAGAVNLTLRGSDLVGSINRTNSTINRVG